MPCARSRSSRIAASSWPCKPCTILRAWGGSWSNMRVARLGSVVQVALDGAAGLDGSDREPGPRLLELGGALAQPDDVVPQTRDEHADEHRDEDPHDQHGVQGDRVG